MLQVATASDSPSQATEVSNDEIHACSSSAGEYAPHAVNHILERQTKCIGVVTFSNFSFLCDQFTCWQVISITISTNSVVPVR